MKGSGLIILAAAIGATVIILNIFMALLGPPRQRRPLAHRAAGGGGGAPFNVGNPIPAPVQRAAVPLPQPGYIENGPVPSPPVSLAGSAESSLHSWARDTYAVGPSATYSETLPITASRGEIKCAGICADLFQGERAIYNYRDRGFLNPDTNRALELDIFYPTLRFAVEYNGEQHYADTARFGVTSTSQAARDQIKAARARDYGICLVSIPYTYDDARIRLTIHRAATAHGIGLGSAGAAARDPVVESGIPAWVPSGVYGFRGDPTVAAELEPVVQPREDPAASSGSRRPPPARPGLAAMAGTPLRHEEPAHTPSTDPSVVRRPPPARPGLVAMSASPQAAGTPNPDTPGRRSSGVL
jgi:hypothetical protein